MATYKVIQDIEAEDKLLGPLTLRQFIYAAIALGCIYLSFLSLTKGAWFLIFAFLPFILIFGFLAWPFSRDQPNEIWLLAKLRFMFKPRRRIWDQAGMKQLVTVTAPVTEQKQYTDGLSQGEVKSRLQALASTLDSRGWAIKNMNVNLFSQPQFAYGAASDRLIDLSALPQEVSGADVTLSDDIMDTENNATAQHLDQMIQATSAAHHQQLRDQMQQAAGGGTATAQPAADYWFMNQPAGQPASGQTLFTSGSTVLPGGAPVNSSATAQPATADEAALLDKLHHKKPDSAAYGHMRTIQPLGSQPAGQPAAKKNDSTAQTPADQRQPASPKTPDPVILELANNDDLNVATIARQANKHQEDHPDDGEVVISLR